ncbi:uncharacterized protein E0L32_003354 [Thyridium curvatum]|uniref:Lysophospholipase n=1 Tax=Thyridium curvatum TaxID=1093900 RepID=A0A507BD85_9PEZI|nr:uncharacterized protein E0L32_003354 [Thyridium curvatum]TPX17236.1 hypothetical protein E0L32_003354 [Thyridium curvatum]
MLHHMVLLPLALYGAGLAGATPLSEQPSSSSSSRLRGVEAIDVRALPNSPSGRYAPKAVDCPAQKPTIRSAATLSKSETDWLKLRRNATVDPMADLLKRANIPDFDAAAYIRRVAGNVSQLPNIAIAASGGGYRALLNGGGFLAAADSRTPGSTGKGGIGGLLQASTYLAGLSGGGWLVGSLYSNNFSSVVQLRDGSPDSSVWKFDRSIFQGPSKSTGFSILNTAKYWSNVADAVSTKDDAGFNVSITDFWGRALSYQLINDTDGGPAYTFSSFADSDSFKQGQQPFPILVADGRAPNTQIISLNSTVYEFNVFEMGSWDPSTFGFAPTEYLGSNFSNGQIEQNGHCVRGFDQAGYVMGTSSSLFNQFLLQDINSVPDVPKFVLDAVTKVFKGLGEDSNDIAQYQPNPFLDYNPSTNPSARSQELSLVDGGEDLQNIPLHPLIQPVRGVDVIFAVDSSADVNNWPNGTALRATYDRSKGQIANGTLFPPVPDEHTFINQGLNRRPTFFGCDVRNFTLRAGQVAPPLVVYVPNAPYTTLSNVTTFQPSYTKTQSNDIIRNGYDSATQGNATVNPDWPVCLSCAILNRSFGKTNTTVPKACADCFTKYCWNGVLDTKDNGPYYPQFIIGNQTTKENAAVGRATAGSASVLTLAVGLAVLSVL